MPRRRCSTSGEGFDWATAEALAFGSLVAEGIAFACPARTAAAAPSASATPSGSTRRGEKYIPLTTSSGGRFEVRDSPLSEFGVLGFEYGYSIADPKTLVLWEAQFGDFANGAQTIIDQFIAAGEAKWLRASGLVHAAARTASKGRGRSISSARLERYLQLCAEDNMQVANCTTPANYFHILRRQMLRDFRKPLIMMTPKSLLRHKLAVSSRADFTGESHFRRILCDSNPPAQGETRRLVLCSGKLAYELMEARDAAGDLGIEIIRIEQLYPFPSEPLVKRLKAMPKLEDVVWAQEEPKNNGAWFFVETLLESCLTEAGLHGHAAAICRPRRRRFAGDRPRQAPCGGAGGLDCRRARAIAAAAPRRPRTRRSGIKGNMATDVKVPTLGESITEGTLGAMAEKARRGGRRGRADRQPRNRQGQRRGAVAGRRRARPSSWSKEGDTVAVGAVNRADRRGRERRAADSGESGGRSDRRPTRPGAGETPAAARRRACARAQPPKPVGRR